MIVVRTGSHGDVVIDGKSLTVIRQPWFNDPKLSSLRIRNLTAHQRVVVRDLRVGATNLELFLCAAESCAGPVFLEELTTRSCRAGTA